MAKNVILQMMVEDSIEDLMVKAGADNIIVDATKNETLASRLASITTAIAAKATPADVDAKISTAINNLINGAPATYDTLKEIADYIASDKTAASAMNTAIAGKVDKVSGQGLSTNDFTTALLNKLNGIAEGANKVEKSSTNGNIKIGGTETAVYAHPTSAGNKHVPSGGSTGQFLGYGGSSGTATWQTPKATIRYGSSTPTDLGTNELFVKIL